MAAKGSKKRSTTKGSAKGSAKKAKAAKAPAKRGKAAKPAKKAAAKRPAPARKAPPPQKAAAPKATSRFVWFELMAKDVGAAQSFYQSLMGWSTKDTPMPPPMNKYTVFSSSGEDFGGLLPLPNPEAPVCWMAYVSVANVDEISRRAAELGGKVVMPPMDIPNVGRFSVISDPTGGVVCPMSFLQPLQPPPERGIMGPVAWMELQTTDPQKAAGFYKELFGWGSSEMDMGPGGKYTVLKAGEHDVGGIGGKAPAMPCTQWLVYFTVDDVDARTQNAVVAGATTLAPAFDIPNIGRMSFIKDPQGAIFALFKGPAAMPA